MWDVLDCHGNKTGKIIQKGEPLREDEYTLFVHIWIFNSKGEILIQKRADHLKHAPGTWAITGGAVIQGEDSRAGACRETKEEIGIDINPKGQPLRHKRQNAFTDIWLVEAEVDLAQVVIEKEEVSDVKWVTKKRLKEMINCGQFHQYNAEYFDLISGILG